MKSEALGVLAVVTITGECPAFLAYSETPLQLEDLAARSR